jgi:hypothetical protein
MKKITVIAVVVALGLFAGAAAVLSWGPGFGPGPGFAPGRARVGRPWWQDVNRVGDAPARNRPKGQRR